MKILIQFKIQIPFFLVFDIKGTQTVNAKTGVNINIIKHLGFVYKSKNLFDRGVLVNAATERENGSFFKDTRKIHLYSIRINNLKCKKVN